MQSRIEVDGVAADVISKGVRQVGGFRSLIIYRARDSAIFVHGFAKKDMENIRLDKLIVLKKLAAEMLAYRKEEFESAVASGTIIEVKCDGKSESVS